MLIGFAMIAMPQPDGLTREGQIVLTMSVVAVILFVTEPVPLPTVALLIIVGQVLLLGLESTTVAKTLMTDSVLFIMGSLMLAVAVVKQKLDIRIAWLIVRMTGTKTTRICFGISLVSGVLASFVGEHTVAAMMLPVGITLITLTSDDPKQVRRLAAVLLFSISYGCSVAGIGTPSGGARNAIMIGYWKEFFYDPTNPETRKFLIDYVTWIAYAYPVFLIQLPFVTLILTWTFKPEYKTLSRSVAKLRQQIVLQGPMKPADWLAILIFSLILLGWIFLSSETGLGHHRRPRRRPVPDCRAGAMGRHQFRRQLGRHSALCSRHLARCADERHRRRPMDCAKFSQSHDAAGSRSGHWTMGGRLGPDTRGYQHHVQRRCGCRPGSNRPENGHCGWRKPDCSWLHHRHILGLCLFNGRGNTCLHHCLCLRLSQDDRLPDGWLAHGGHVDNPDDAGGIFLLASARELRTADGV